jgi:hypothetical protein
MLIAGNQQTFVVRLGTKRVLIDYRYISSLDFLNLRNMFSTTTQWVYVVMQHFPLSIMVQQFEFTTTYLLHSTCSLGNPCTTKWCSLLNRFWSPWPVKKTLTSFLPVQHLTVETQLLRTSDENLANWLLMNYLHVTIGLFSIMLQRYTLYLNCAHICEAVLEKIRLTVRHSPFCLLLLSLSVTRPLWFTGTCGHMFALCSVTLMRQFAS